MPMSALTRLKVSLAVLIDESTDKSVTENIIVYVTYIDAPGTRISSPLIGSEHEFKTKDSVGWYDLYAHQHGVNKRST